MARYAAGCALAAIATLTAAESAEECAERAADVVVEALQFSDGRSYAYLVVNNGTTPIYSVCVGWGAFIEGAYNTEPVSVGSPAGWEGMHVVVPDPRLPQSHSPRLVKYRWNALDNQKAWIQPGRSLSGFSVQLPTPRETELAYRHFWGSRGFASDLPKDPPLAERLPPQPDLADVPFGVLRSGGCPVVGTVELDKVPGAATPSLSVSELRTQEAVPPTHTTD